MLVCVAARKLSTLYDEQLEGRGRLPLSPDQAEIKSIQFSCWGQTQGPVRAKPVSTTELNQPWDTPFLDTDRTLWRKCPRSLKDSSVLFLLYMLHLAQGLAGMDGPAG